jgi:hypothetical protein
MEGYMTCNGLNLGASLDSRLGAGGKQLQHTGHRREINGRETGNQRRPKGGQLGRKFAEAPR